MSLKDNENIEKFINDNNLNEYSIDDIIDYFFNKLNIDKNHILIKLNNEIHKFDNIKSIEYIDKLILNSLILQVKLKSLLEKEESENVLLMVETLYTNYMEKFFIKLSLKYNIEKFIIFDELNLKKYGYNKQFIHNNNLHLSDIYENGLNNLLSISSIKKVIKQTYRSKYDFIFEYILINCVSLNNIILNYNNYYDISKMLKTIISVINGIDIEKDILLLYKDLNNIIEKYNSSHIIKIDLIKDIYNSCKNDIERYNMLKYIKNNIYYQKEIDIRDNTK